MPNRKRHVAITAPPEAWQRLGRLLAGRRRELGHTWRTTFEAETNLNRRMQADFESAAKNRINHFSPATWQDIARAYRVTEASMAAVLRGEADRLEPAPPAPAPAEPEAADAWVPPMTEPERIAADRPYADEINDRRVRLGTADPPGRDLFGPGSRYAALWDELRAEMPIRDRVWFIADLWRRADDRNRGGRRSGAAGG